MPSEIVEIALDLILLNDTNPRGFIDQEVVNTLSLSMAADGQKTEIKVRRVENSQYRVVGGDHRVLAARKLGWKTIKGVVLDITAEDAGLEAYLDNLGKPMIWFSDYLAVESLWNRNKGTGITQKAVADRLMKTETLVSRALKLLPLLNSSARELILASCKNPNGYQLLEVPIRPLTALAKGQPNDQAVVEAALKVVYDRQMTKSQVQKLVIWMQKGNSPESFPASGKTEVQKGSKNQRFDPNDPLAHIWKDLPKGARIRKTPKGYQLSWKLSEADAPLAVKGALAGLAGTMGEKPNPTVADANQPVSPASSTKIYMFRDWMAGVKVIPQLKHKVEKGETLTFGESMVLGGYRLGEGGHWLWKEMVKPFLKSLSEKLKKTLGKTLYYICIGLLLCFLVSKVWPVFQAVLHPIHWVESKFHHQPPPPPVLPAEPTPDPADFAKSAQSNQGTRLEASPQATAVGANIAVSKAPAIAPTPTYAPASPKPTATPRTDVAGQVLKQVAPDVAGDVAKKLFGL